MSSDGQGTWDGPHDMGRVTVVVVQILKVVSVLDVDGGGECGT